MSTRHTPGPWTIKATDVYETIVASDDELVAFISIKDDCEANARLIAAAPEMLAELQSIQNIMEDSGRAGCKYGDTDFDSLSVVHGYNLALQHVKSHITSVAKAILP